MNHADVEKKQKAEAGNEPTSVIGMYFNPLHHEDQVNILSLKFNSQTIEATTPLFFISLVLCLLRGYGKRFFIVRRLSEFFLPPSVDRRMKHCSRLSSIHFQFPSSNQLRKEHRSVRIEINTHYLTFWFSSHIQSMKTISQGRSISGWLAYTTRHMSLLSILQHWDTRPTAYMGERRAVTHNREG